MSQEQTQNPPLEEKYEGLTSGPRDGVASEVAIDVEGEVADLEGHGLSSKGGAVLLVVLSYFTVTSMQPLPDP